MEGDGDQQDGEKKDDGKKQEETPNPVPNDVEIASQLQQQFLSEYSNYQSGSANPPFPANPPPPGSVSADVNAVLDSLGMGPQNPPPQSAYPPANLGPAPVTTPASSFGANDVELAKSLIESLAHEFYGEQGGPESAKSILAAQAEALAQIQASSVKAGQMGQGFGLGQGLGQGFPSLSPAASVPAASIPAASIPAASIPASGGQGVSEKGGGQGDDSDDDGDDDMMDLNSLRQMQQVSVQKLFSEKKEVPKEEKKGADPKPSDEVPSPSEGKKEVVEGSHGEKRDDKKSKECLICRSTLQQYIVFPNCKIPHLYCVLCAENMLNAPQPRQGGYAPKPRNQAPKCVKCAFCQAISPLDERGLNAFKRTCRRPTPSFKTGICERHPGQPIHYYCLDCEIPACWDCSQFHGSHNFDTLETAFQKSKQSLLPSTEKLTNTRKMLADYKVTLEEERLKVLENRAAKEAELSEHLVKIRDILSRAEEKLKEGIDQTARGRLVPLESEEKWSKEKIELTETSVDAMNRLISTENPLQFFQQLSENNEKLSDARNVATKKPPPMRPFPPLPTRGLIQALQSVNYSGQPQFDLLGSGSYDDEEWDSDLDDEDEDMFYE